jgi:oxygen-independent coproporphyrinogen-3 oxidase
MLSPASPVAALYVHVPFCRNICGYCDFYKVPLRADLAAATVDALLTELHQAAGERPLALRTVFFGGGTPTELPTGLLERLVEACGSYRAREGATPAPSAPAQELQAWEFTVEANPATVTDEKAGVLRAAGVNRISMGAQSFDHEELRFLDRTHRPEQVVESVALCRRHGFAAINLDLIFGAAGQTVATWTDSLRRAIDLGVEHLSCYALTYEEGTTLYRRLQTGRVLQMDNDLEADLYEVAMDYLAAAGFGQYEISNYARPAFECRHNLVYWHNQPHLAIGPSACGYVDGVRYRNVPDVRQYVDAIHAGRRPRVSEERLDAAQAARETAMLALRLNAGLDRAAFGARFGVEAVDFFRAALAQTVPEGLVEVTPTAIRLSRRGRLLGDSVMATFLR